MTSPYVELQLLTHFSFLRGASAPEELFSAAALLGYDRSSPDDVVDPGSRGPSVWFQHSDATAPDRQRWHLDVRVPHDEAQRRLAAVVEAGGRLVDESRAPAFWVVEDVEGNRSCITTWQGRD